MTDALWTVHALKYAERNTRARGDSFLFDDDHASPHDMDYFIWVLRSGDRVILVDSGYDADEAARRGRPILRDPADALAAVGVGAEQVDTLIVTHLHYDHAGGLHRFPNAVIHLQAAEMAFATGPCMCHGAMRAPFTADFVCEAIQRVYSGRAVFHEGDGVVAPGVTVHRIGGHSRGLQAVRVKTARGWICLASDAAHYYENAEKKKAFPIVVDLEDMMRGFERILELGGGVDGLIPGHDPLVRARYPVDGADFVFRLDVPPRA